MKKRVVLFIYCLTNQRKYKNDTNVRKNNVILLNYRLFITIIQLARSDLD